MASVMKRKPTEEERIKLMNAAKTGDVSAVQLLATNGVNFTGILTIGNHWNALHYAASRGHYNVATCLISYGAGVNDMDKRQWTPLHLAASQGHAEIVDLLVRNGADINIKDNWNKTPLQGALDNGKFEVVCYFIKQLNMDTKKFDDKTQQRIDELLKEAERNQSELSIHPNADQESTTITGHSVELQTQLLGPLPSTVRPQPRVDTVVAKTAKLKEKPTHKMLSRITDILTADWRRIGYELLEPKYVKNIESTTKQNEEKCLDMLIKWLETDTSASYSKLIEALIECNLLNAAEKIKEKASKQL